MNKTVRDSDKEGHIDNLSPEQEGKLKEIWNKFFSAVGDARQKAKKAADEGNVEEEQKKQKRPALNKRSTTATPIDKDDAEKGQQSAEQEAQGPRELLKEYGKEGMYQHFWLFCMAEDPDVLMLRFLRARKWDVEKAFNMLTSTIKWRIDTDIAGILERGEEGLCKSEGVKKNFKLGKSFAFRHDREGKPITYALAKAHKASDQTAQEMLEYIVYQMETSKTLFALDSGIETSSVVFDLHGLGMGNVDWDTANMVIRIFQSYYPETLGHAVIWNAPTLFSGMWKIVKGMLDPAVKEKIAFASTQKEISEFIDPKILPKDFGGNSPWRYRFTEPIGGENDHMKDNKEEKEKRLAAYQSAASKFEDATQQWIEGESSAKTERRKLAKAFAVRRLDADPYLRGKTVFAREGTVVGDGTVVWKYDHGSRGEFGTSGNEWASEVGIQDPPERPHNKDENDIVLSSSEDTVSDTTDSEDDILDDPNHHHHNSVAVGFAKFGDGVANTFSKIGKGPSLHAKRKQKREEKHARHEAIRQKKLEAKKQRIEAEQAHQEKLEEDNRKAEEEGAMDASYQAYLAKFAHLPIDAISGAATGAATVAHHVKEATVGAANEPTDEKKEKKADKETKKAEAAAGNSNGPAILAVLVAIVVAYFGGSFLISSITHTLFSKAATSAVSHAVKGGSTSSVHKTRGTVTSSSSTSVRTPRQKSATETVTTSVVTKYVTATASSPSSSASAGSVVHPFSESVDSKSNDDAGDLVKPASQLSVGSGPGGSSSSSLDIPGTPLAPSPSAASGVAPGADFVMSGTVVVPASSAKTTLGNVEILD